MQFKIIRRPYSQIEDISETEAKSVFYFSIQVQLTILIKKCSFNLILLKYVSSFLSDALFNIARIN